MMCDRRLKIAENSHKPRGESRAEQPTFRLIGQRSAKPLRLSRGILDKVGWAAVRIGEPSFNF